LYLYFTDPEDFGFMVVQLFIQLVRLMF